MKRLLLTFLVSLCFYAEIHAQAENETNTLEQQFTDVFEKSNSYQDYKVIKKFKLNQLRKSVSDSVSALEAEIKSISESLESQQSEIESLKQTLAATNNDLAASREKEDGIHLFGMLLKKSTYNTILWSIIGLLLFLLVVFVLRYRNSNTVTKEAKLKLSETEEEFDAHRARALEREQQLRRKLQDELNKQK